MLPALAQFPDVANRTALDERLRAMRAEGDPPADIAVEMWRRVNRGIGVRQLADLLVGFDNAPAIDALLHMLSTGNGPMAAAIDPALRIASCSCSPATREVAERVFARHGLKMLMILVFYSLPASYAAHRGVRVLHSDHGSTGFLVSDLNRRLIETAQFVLQVFASGGLNIDPRGGVDRHGPAVRAALRVRLLHATVRAAIEGHTAKRWDAQQFGKPVNQEDMAGTLMTFSWVTIDGMRKLNLGLTASEEEAVLEVWKSVGALLGVDPALIPNTVADAEVLTEQIRARQVEGPIAEARLAGTRNDFGIEMTRSLLVFLQNALPPPLRWFRRLPASVMRFFLPSAPEDVAGSLGVPRTIGLDELVRLWFWFEGRLTRFAIFEHVNRLVFHEWGRKDPRALALFQTSRFFMKRLVRTMENVDRNVPLTTKHRTPHMDLCKWDEAWHFDQADCVTRGLRQVRKAVGR